MRLLSRKMGIKGDRLLFLLKRLFIEKQPVPFYIESIYFF